MRRCFGACLSAAQEGVSSPIHQINHVSTLLPALIVTKQHQIINRSESQPRWLSTTSHQQQGSRTSMNTTARVALLATGAGLAAFTASQLLSNPETKSSRKDATPQGQPQANDPLIDALNNHLQDQQTQPPAATQDTITIEAPSTAAQVAATQSGKQGLQGPWVTDDDLAAALQRRALAENRLRGYLYVKQREVQKWLDEAQYLRRVPPEELEKEMIAVEEEVNRHSNLIMYGIDDPDARKDYLAKYGCSKWSEQALDTIRSYSPLIELGAGLGHWQKELAAKGADCLSYDNMSQLPVPDVRTQKPQFVGKVLQGDEKEIKKHPKRTLLLVYPGPDDLAANALRMYTGNTLLYVGESRGGFNGTPEFFDALEKDWECQAVVAVEPFPEGYEKLWVLKRKSKSGRKWLGW